MKKLVSIVLVIAIAALCAVNVFADTASEKARLIKALEDFEVTVNGNTLVFDTADINAAKNYLTAAYKGDIEAAMVDTVITNLNEAAGIVKAAASYAEINTLRDIRKLNETDRKAILALGNDAVNAFGLYIKYDAAANKVDYIRISDDVVVFESNATLIKKTGASVNVVPMIAVSAFVAIAVIGSAIVVKKFALAK